MKRDINTVLLWGAIVLLAIVVTVILVDPLATMAEDDPRRKVIPQDCDVCDSPMDDHLVVQGIAVSRWRIEYKPGRGARVHLYLLCPDGTSWSDFRPAYED